MAMPAPTTQRQPVTFGATSARQIICCRVCGRTLLIGERSFGYFTGTGEGPFDVCELCVPRAHRFGLRPHPSTSSEVEHAQRGSRLARIRTALGKRRSRSPRVVDDVVQGSAAVVGGDAAVPAGRRRSRRSAVRAATDPAALGTVPAGAAAVPLAVAAFNRSPHARTLAGLYRTLGAPRANVQPRTATDREVIITVAWEIVWYQFRVMPDGIEQVHGTYLSELHGRWQRWNCSVTPEGAVLDPREDVVVDGHYTSIHEAEDTAR